MTSSLRLLFLPLLLAPAMAAQQPAPAAETDASVWSAEEGNILFYMRLNFWHIREAAKPARFGAETSRIGGYSLRLFSQNDTGGAQPADAVANDQALFAIAWPVTVGPDTRRAVLMHSDGTTLFCEPDATDVPELDAGLALAKGSPGRFRDALRQPGTGSQGHLWQWLEQAGSKATVQVVDERGNPRAGVVIEVVGAGKAQRASTVALPQPLPLARGTTGQRGIALLAGPRCRATAAMLHAPDATIAAGRVTVEVAPGGLRLVVPDAALVNAAALANESAAIATLKNISSAQAQCQASAAIDANGNGAGEYGFFGELSGVIAVRNGAKGGIGEQKINPPVLSTAFSKVAGSRVARSGYVFQMFLPDAKGKPVAEAPAGGGAGVAIDATRAEVLWCCYAWPASPTSGLRAFFVNQGGDVLACNNDKSRYQGTEHPLMPDAAFAADTAGTMDSTVAANATGLDGQKWFVVN